MGGCWYRFTLVIPIFHTFSPKYFSEGIDPHYSITFFHYTRGDVGGSPSGPLPGGDEYICINTITGVNSDVSVPITIQHVRTSHLYLDYLQLFTTDIFHLIYIMV